MLAVLAAGAWSFFSTHSALGVTLDWSQVSWPQNSLTNSFDIDPINPGDDIRITVTGDVQYITGNNPQVDTIVTGGYGTGTSTLNLTTTFDTLFQSWTVTVEFLYGYGVSNATFVVLDVDTVTSPPPQDELRNIYGIAPGSTNLVAPTIVGSADNQVTGSGVNQVVTGLLPNQQSSADGNVYISFSNTAISTFTYTFGNVTQDYKGRIVSQHNALYNIVYTGTVPEIGVGSPPAVIGAFALAVLLVRRFRAVRTVSG